MGEVTRMIDALFLMEVMHKIHAATTNDPMIRTICHKSSSQQTVLWNDVILPSFLHLLIE